MSVASMGVNWYVWNEVAGDGDATQEKQDEILALLNNLPSTWSESEKDAALAALTKIQSAATQPELCG